MARGRESAQRYRFRLDQVKAPPTSWTPCRCPRCHKGHQKKMNWIGGVLPAPFFCTSCDGIVGRILDVW